MKGKYVVLRTPAAGFGPGLRALPGGEIQVETRELTSREFRELPRDGGILSFAPLMPLRLHEPIKRGEQPLEDGDETWGVRAVGAHQSPFTGEGIKVAVLDTGIDAGHEAFGGLNIVQKDFTADAEGDGDENGHGTHCAGTIFGRKVGALRIGVAPGIDQALIGKVLGRKGGGSTEGIVQGIQWALDSGANVISISLGIDFPGYVEDLVRSQGLPVALATSKGLEAYRANANLFASLAAFAKSRGDFRPATVLVAASGNESRKDENAEFEIAASPPAAVEGILAVGALRRGPNGLEAAPFSNTLVDLAGPGVDIVSACAGGGVTTMSGTSMATPHVAGTAALWAESLLKSDGRIRLNALTAKLMASGTYLPLAPGFNPLDVGTGLVQAP